MRATLLWSAFAVLNLGCWNPVIEFPLGSIDSGSRLDGGATGGGTATGGGSGGGGGTAMGTGGGLSGTGGGREGWSLELDAGIIAQLPALPPSDCDREMTLSNPCSDGGTCLGWLPANGTRTEVPISFGLQRVLAQTPSGLLIQTPAPQATVAVVDTAGQLSTLFATNATGFFTTGVASVPNVGTWFVISAGEEVRLHFSQGTDFGTVIATLPAIPVATPVAEGTTYFTAHEDGLYEYGFDHSARLYATGEATRITQIAANATEVLFMQYRPEPFLNQVWRFDRATRQSAKLFDVPEPVSAFNSLGHSLLWFNGSFYLLTPLYLLKLDLANTRVETVYRGDGFPQWWGTLKSGSLVSRGNKLYFGSICHFDADAPGFATVELDPVARDARWLDSLPTWPAVPYVTAREGFIVEGPVWASTSGAFLGTPH